MLNKIRIVENITSHYVAALGLYRFFYILNWIYRYQVDGKYCLTQILSGLLQTGFYCDFLYRYYVAIKEGNLEAKTECYVKDKLKSPPFLLSFYDDF